MHNHLYKSLVLFLLFGIIISNAYGQQQQHLPPVDSLAARHARTMSQQFALNTDQQKRLAQAYLYRLRELKQLGLTDIADTTAREEALYKIHTAYETAIKEIMNSGQLQQYEQWKEKLKARLKTEAQAKGIRIKE